MTKMFSRINDRLKSTTFPPEVYTNVYYIDAQTMCDHSDLQCFIDEVHLNSHGNKLLATYIVNEVKNKGFAIK